MNEIIEYQCNTCKQITKKPFILDDNWICNNINLEELIKYESRTYNIPIESVKEFLTDLYNEEDKTRFNELLPYTHELTNEENSLIFCKGFLEPKSKKIEFNRRLRLQTEENECFNCGAYIDIDQNECIECEIITPFSTIM